MDGDNNPATEHDEELKQSDNPYLRQQQKSQAEPEISNIERLFKKVQCRWFISILKLIFVAEFNHFSKNFVEKAPKPKTDGLKDFLNMFD